LSDGIANPDVVVSELEAQKRPSFKLPLIDRDFVSMQQAVNITLAAGKPTEGAAPRRSTDTIEAVDLQN